MPFAKVRKYEVDLVAGSIPFQFKGIWAINRKGYTSPRVGSTPAEMECPADSLEEVQGDLQELYAHWVETVGEKEARRRFVLNAIRLQRPFTSNERNGSHSSVRFRDMIQHYGIVAFQECGAQQILLHYQPDRTRSWLACSLFMISLGFRRTQSWQLSRQ